MTFSFFPELQQQHFYNSNQQYHKCFYVRIRSINKANNGKNAIIPGENIKLIMIKVQFRTMGQGKNEKKKCFYFIFTFRFGVVLCPKRGSVTCGQLDPQ